MLEQVGKTVKLFIVANMLSFFLRVCYNEKNKKLVKNDGGSITMKNKKLVAFMMAAVLGIGSLSVSMYTGKDTKLPDFPTEITVEAAAAPSATTLASAVKKAYGKNYLPSYKLGATEIKDRYGVASSLYSSVYAEVPMMTAHVDELVIFQAKNDASKKQIKKAVKKYQKQLKESTMQYPMNLLKIQGSKVYTNDNYVCFIMLGSISKKTEEQGSDSDIIKAYQKQNKKAVNAMKKQLK